MSHRAIDVVGKAGLLIDAGLARQALAILERHLASNPDDPSALRLLANASCDLGQLDQAERASA